MIRKIAQKVRHLPGLKKFDGLWSVIRKPYHRFLNLGGGVQVKVGGKVSVRMPAEYAGVNWEDYEPETVTVFRDWVAANPTGWVLDVGSSVGIFSLVALCSSPHVSVVAFDSDTPSLAALQKLCHYVSGNRLQVVRGFVAAEGRGTRGHNLSGAVKVTEKLLADTAPKGNLESITFTCLNHANPDEIPSYTLDELLSEPDWAKRKCLIKCDVEGAELLVLRGSEKILRKASPDLLLSVHLPHMLAEYGCTQDQVKKFLESFGYQIKVVAIDHEEHWWCERSSIFAKP